MGKRREDAVSRVNAHQEVTSTEAELRIEWIGRLFCGQSAFSSIHPCAHEQSGHGSRNGGKHRFNNMGFRSRRLTWLQLLLCTTTANSRNQALSPRYGAIPWGDSDLTIMDHSLRGKDNSWSFLG